MYDRVFNRVEEKYLLDKNKYRKLLQILKSKIEKDKYFKTTICNIYFDTFDNELIIESLEKPIYKHKVRLRSYGVPTLEDDVFLEVKFKYKKIVGKRRWRLKLKDFERYLIGKKDIVDNQIMRELDYLFERYHLEPSYFIAYDRKSYKGKEDESLRITFDTNLRSRQSKLQLELGDFGTTYFKEDECIMEIKTLGAMPLWLVRTLSELQIYPISFSKYGSIYQKNCEEYLC